MAGAQWEHPIQVTHRFRSSPTSCTMALIKDDRKAVRERLPCFKSCDLCIRLLPHLPCLPSRLLTPASPPTHLILTASRRWHNPLTWLHLKSFLMPDALAHSLDWCTRCASTVAKQETTCQLSRRDRSAERSPKMCWVARSVNLARCYETVSLISSPFF